MIRIAPRVRNTLLICLCLVLVFWLGTLRQGREQIITESLFPAQHPAVIAHQGGNLEHPGNTLQAFRHAMALGVDVLEMDVHTSLDGHLMVIHDATVDRTTNGHGAVADMTRVALQTLDAGYFWPHVNGELQSDAQTQSGRDFPWRNRGLYIPALEEVLAGFPQAFKIIELKPEQPAVAEQLCALLRAAEQQRRVVVASFHAAALNAFRNACPTVATSASPAESLRFVVLGRLGLQGFFASPALALHLPLERSGFRLLSAPVLADAKALGLRIDYWTINSLEDMRSAIELGAHGIMTDRPEMLLRELGRIR